MGAALAKIAQRRLAEIEANRPPAVVPSLAEWVTRIPVLAAKGYVQPLHLHRLLEVFARIIRGEQVRVVVHSPPRGAKTETLLAAIGWLLKQRPTWEIGYCSYNSDQARSKAVRARNWAKAMGVAVVRDTVKEWRTPQDGGCIARGVDEGITGQGQDVTIVDDPHKGRAEAESAVARARVWDWFNDSVFTRGNPSSSAAPRPRSIIVNGARWHTEDLSGMLIAQGWEYICLPALVDGRSYWPEMWSPAQLEEIRKQIGEYSFASLYQGTPRPRGGTLFGDAHLYDTRPPTTYRVAFGLDCSYSKRTAADWSVCVVLCEERYHLSDGTERKRYYVLDVLRSQERLPEFVEAVKKLGLKYGSAPPTRFYVATSEVGGADLMKTLGLSRLRVVRAHEDKHARAQPVAAAWNDGRVLVPADAARSGWVGPFCAEVAGFTGVRDSYDDQVDALAAAYDELAAGITDVQREVRIAAPQGLRAREL